MTLGLAHAHSEKRVCRMIISSVGTPIIVVTYTVESALGTCACGVISNVLSGITKQHSTYIGKGGTT